MLQEAGKNMDLLRKWVETWQRAGPELEAIQLAELRSADTREAIRQIFGDGDLPPLPPAPATSGLVEQQAWFAKLRQARNDP